MLSGLEFLLTPLIYILDVVFTALRNLFGSAGLSIIALSTLVALLAYPLRRWAQRIEERVRKRVLAVGESVQELAHGLKGEERFRVVEKVYEQHDYHPLQSIALGLPFFVMLPFLLAALFLFTNNPSLEGIDFLLIPDLSEPDKLFLGFNFLPIIMTGITIVDAILRFRDDRSSMIKFFIISIVLFVLVYSFSSALVLYWTVSNAIVFLNFLFVRYCGRL